MSVNQFLQFGSWNQTDLSFHDLAALENKDRRQHRDAIFGSQRHVGIYVDFGNFSCAFVVSRELFDNWTQFSTGASRRRPKIYQDRSLRLQHFGIEGFVI